jgi:peptide/nickel transport system substrate-binding protein
LFEEAYYNSYDALPDSTDPSYQDALDARTASRALLISIATKWSTAFNITTVDSSTNPLLLISNGGFMVETITKQAATLKLNPLASVSGTPKMTGNLQNLVFAFPASKASFSDVAAAQALANKQIDAYSGAANAAVWQELSKNTSITKSQASSASYEHLDLRTGTSNTGANPGDADVSCPATYTGPFAGESQRAKDLRHAFLLVVPRQLIANTYVGRVFDPTTTANSPVLQSSLLLTTEGNYAKQVTGLKSYVDEFSKSQADRNALALTLVKKYYPNAGPGTNNISINYLRNTSDRRADINLQIKLEAAKVGFNVSNEGNGNWPDYLDCNFYDVADFAWSRSAISQTGNNANYVSTGGNNTYGWSDSAVDTSFDQFSLNLSATELSTASVNTEKLLYSHYWTLPLYQWPGVAAWNSDLKGVLYNPLNPNLVWNYWAWGY